MESLAPPLELLIEVKRSIEKGQSTRQGILSYIKKSKSTFRDDVSKWFIWVQQGQKIDSIMLQQRSISRKALFQLLERGLRGEAIYSQLQMMEQEIKEACQDEQAKYLARLPFLMLVPLLFLMFPAYLLLLFGPLLTEFLKQLGGQP